MLTAVVTPGEQIRVKFLRAEEEEGGAEHHSDVDCEFELEADEANGEYPCAAGPSPIMPEVKELAWGGGAFVVLALVMRFLLYPRLKSGMDARYAHIRGSRESADAARAAAQSEVADYERALAAVKAEANARVEAARQTLEAERSAKLAEVNAQIAVTRDAAAAEARTARQAVESDVAAAARQVTARTLELALGTAPDPAAVQAAVDAVAGVRS